jgi:hypothetical protein
MKRKLALMPLAVLVVLIYAAPCFAIAPSIGTTGLGAGVLFPDIEGLENDNSIYYILDYKTMNYLFEIDYFNDAEMDGWMMHGDYLYPLTGALESEAYLGFGYSYLFGNSDVLDDENGFNIALGLSLQNNLDVRGRYLFLGGGDHIFTAGATMSF